VPPAKDPREKSPRNKSPPGQKTPGEKVPSGDIVYSIAALVVIIWLPTAVLLGLSTLLGRAYFLPEAIWFSVSQFIVGNYLVVTADWWLLEDVYLVRGVGRMTLVGRCSCCYCYYFRFLLNRSIFLANYTMQGPQKWTLDNFWSRMFQILDALTDVINSIRALQEHNSSAHTLQWITDAKTNRRMCL